MELENELLVYLVEECIYIIENKKTGERGRDIGNENVGGILLQDLIAVLT